MTTAPAPQPTRPAIRQLLGDNPAVVLTFVFVALFLATDVVNRAQKARRS